MIRYAFFLMAVLGSFAAALAAVEPAAAVSAKAATTGSNETTIEKNSPFPVLGPITLQQCAVEDCSDLPG